MTAESNNRHTLRQLILEHFSFDDIRGLCFDLGVDYEDLGEGLPKSARIVALIKSLQREGRLDALLDWLSRERPNVAWPDELTETALGLDQDYLQQDWAVLEKQYMEAAASEWQYVRNERKANEGEVNEGEVSELSLTNVYALLQAVEPTSKRTVQLRDAPSSLTRRDTAQTERAEPGGRYEGEAESPHEHIYPLVSLAQALKEHDYLVLLGEAGSGKSIMLQFITLCFSKGEEAKAKLDLNEARIPVLISLPEHAETIAKQHLEVALASEVRRLTTATDSEAMKLVRRWRDEGRLAVLLDGFDEVVDEIFRQRLVKEIRPFASIRSERGATSRVVLASRPDGYLRLGAPFTEYEVKPFEGAEDAEQYIADWVVALTMNKPKWEEFTTEELVQRIKSQIRLPDIASNPLLLRLTVEVFVVDGEVAKNQAQLFRKYIETVLWKKAVNRGLREESKATVIEALETVAWALNAEGKAPRDEVIIELNAASAESDSARMEAEQLLDLLIEKLGLLRQSASLVAPHVEFRRKTYQEYFVARRLVKAWLINQKRVKRFLRPRLHHPRWRGPVMLLAMMLDPVNASNLLRYILVAKSPYEKHLARDLLLAGDCLRTGAQVDSALRRNVFCRLASTYRNRVALFRDQGSSHPVIEPIRQIFAAAEEDDRAAALEIMLTLFKGSKSVKSPTALRLRIILSIGALRITGRLATQILVDALEDPSVSGEAAQVLAEVGPSSSEIMERMISALQRRRSSIGWDNNVAEMVQALGVLSQRDERLVERMIAVVNTPEDETGFRDVHYAVIMALCKSSETSVTALDFVLRAWRNFKTMNEPVREGLKDGSKLRLAASPDVLGYLLRTVHESEDWSVRSQAWGLLSGLLKDSPVVQCRVVEPDGVINFKMLDVTEDVFSLFLLRPPVHPNELLLGGSLGLFVQWCLPRPELAVRLIQMVHDADPWLLAAMLEEPADPIVIRNSLDVRTDHHTTIARLRSPQKAVRDAELKRLLVTDAVVETNDLFFAYPPNRISRTKCEYLHKAYRLTVNRTWEGAKEQPFDPYVVAALACFRGWHFLHGYGYGLSDTELRTEFVSRTEKALSILRSRPRESLDVLSSVILREEARLVNTIAQQRVEAREQAYEEEKKTRRPDFMERATAAYAIAKLNSDYPEAEQLLLSCLRPEYWDEDRSAEQSEFQYQLIRSLGFVTNASRELVEVLYEIMTIDGLKRPSHEAVAFLIEQYEELDNWKRISVLNAVGAERPVSEKALALLLRAVKDRDDDVRAVAAIQLSRLVPLEEKPQKDEIIEALASLIDDTPEVVEPVARVIDTIPLTGEKKLSAKLYRYAKRIAKVYQAPVHTSRVFRRSTHDLADEALSSVVGQLTRNEVKSLKDTLLEDKKGSLLQRLPGADFSLITDTIVSTILALSTNIVAAYLQDQFDVINYPIRLTIVFVVFFISLSILALSRHLKNTADVE